MTTTSLGAILLAGGRSRRMGGADKTSREIHGRSLFAIGVDAARRAGCTQVVAVGPEKGGHPGIEWTREDPPFGGPAAAILAGARRLRTEWALVLACDLPFAPEVAAILGAARRAHDGVHLVDVDGQVQWLAGVYRVSALVDSGEAAGTDGRSVRSLLSGLDLRSEPAAFPLTLDVDTAHDLSEARRWCDPDGGRS